MGTTIKELDGRYELRHHNVQDAPQYGKSTLSITRFWGGEKNKTMIQITIYNNDECSYVQLTRRQVKKLAEVLKDCYNWRKYPSE